MDIQEIISKIQSALKFCADSNGIESKELRVKIYLQKGFISSTVKCSVMRKTDVVGDVNLKDLLGLTPIQSPLVNMKLVDSLSKFAIKDSISKDIVNGRFFTTSEDFTPRLYLYDGEAPVREIKIEELIN